MGFNMNIITKAAQFAAEAHEGQLRKDNKTPFIYHPMWVAGRLQILGCPEETIAAGWLHDTIEDCGILYEDIYENFGKVVAELVQEVTNVYTKNVYKSLHRKDRKSRELERIKTISDEAKIIKAVDRIHNLQSVELLGFYYIGESLDLLDIIGPCIPEELYDELDYLIDVKKLNYDIRKRFKIES